MNTEREVSTTGTNRSGAVSLGEDLSRRVLRRRRQAPFRAAGRRGGGEAPGRLASLGLTLFLVALGLGGAPVTAHAQGIDYNFCAYDFSFSDGDTIDILLNGEPVVSNLVLTNEERCTRFTAREGGNSLQVHADNQGESGPNTAAMRIRSVDTQNILNPPGFNPLGWNLQTDQTVEWVFYAVGPEEIRIEEDAEPGFGGRTIGALRFFEGRTITPVTLPAATDGNAPLNYRLSPALPAGLEFSAANRTISGTPTSPSSPATYTYTVTDTDGDSDSLTFTIEVLPDNMPDFGGATIADQRYVENQAAAVTLPAATGGDGPLVYTLSPALPAGLEFSAANRTISGTPTSPSSPATYTYTVTDTDGDSDSLTFTIEVLPDNMPDFGGATIADQRYVENQAAAVTLPAATGGDGPLVHTLSPALPAGLEFSAANRTISGTPTSPSSPATYTYTVTDADGDSDSLTFTIEVLPDNMPDFGGATIADQRYVENQAAAVTLPAATGGDGPLVHTLSPALPAGLEFSAANRTISGTPTSPSSPATYTYTVTDADGDSDSLTFTIEVLPDNMPDFGGATIADQRYVENQAAAVTLPAATGGDGPLVHTLSPALLAGLEFSAANRTISGTPTSPSSPATYTYTVTDADGDTDSLTFTIEVLPDNTPGFEGATIADQRYVENQAAAVTLPAATGGDGPLVYTLSPALPAGLEFSAANRTISGTPTSPSPLAIYTYTVTDADGDTDSLTFTLVVEEDLVDEEQAAIEETVAAVTAATAANIAANIGTRFAAARSGGTVVVGGQPVSLRPVPESAFNPLAPERDLDDPFSGFSPVARGRSLGLDDVLRSSAFEIALNAADDAMDGAAMGPQWTFWGRGDLQFFESLPERGSTYDGSLAAAYLGVDARTSAEWLFGVAASLTKTEADYGLGDGSGAEGRLDARITGVHPYLRYAPDETSEVWTILGLAQGEITNERAGAPGSETSDMNMRMAAAGARRNLVSDGPWNVALLGDLGFAEVETEDGVQAIQGLSVDTWRGRLGVEGSHTAALEGGYAVTTFAEVAGRYDGGGDVDEVGLEVSPGVYVAGPNGFGLEARGRMLILHTAENYEEYGASLTLSMSPRPDGSGLSLSVEPSVGAETGGADGLWREDPFALSGARAAKRDPLSLDVGVGYGVRAMNGLLTPFGEYNLSNDARRRLRAGARFNLTRSSLGAVSLEVAGERHEHAGSEPEHRLGVVGRLRF